MLEYNKWIPWQEAERAHFQAATIGPRSRWRRVFMRFSSSGGTINHWARRTSQTGRTWRICDSSLKKKDKIHLLIVPIVVAIYFLFSYTFWQPLWFGAVLFEEISDLSVSKKAGIKEPAAGSLLSSALKKIWEFEIWGEKKREREKKRGQGKHRTPP